MNKLQSSFNFLHHWLLPLVLSTPSLFFVFLLCFIVFILYIIAPLSLFFFVCSLLHLSPNSHFFTFVLWNVHYAPYSLSQLFQPLNPSVSLSYFVPSYSSLARKPFPPPSGVWKRRTSITSQSLSSRWPPYSQEAPWTPPNYLPRNQTIDFVCRQGQEGMEANKKGEKTRTSFVFCFVLFCLVFTFVFEFHFVPYS